MKRSRGRGIDSFQNQIKGNAVGSLISWLPPSYAHRPPLSSENAWPLPGMGKCFFWAALSPKGLPSSLATWPLLATSWPVPLSSQDLASMLRWPQLELAQPVQQRGQAQQQQRVRLSWLAFWPETSLQQLSSLARPSWHQRRLSSQERRPSSAIRLSLDWLSALC